MKINTKRHTQRRQMHTTIVISQSSTKSMVKQNERKTHKQNERKTHKQRERERELQSSRHGLRWERKVV